MAFVYATTLSPRSLPRCAVSSSPTATPAADSLVRLGNSPLQVSPPPGPGAIAFSRTPPGMIKILRIHGMLSMSQWTTASPYSTPLRFMGVRRAIKDRERKGGSGKPIVATKFAALPWRFTRRSVVVALKQSLSRLGLSSIDLYQLHWPGLWGNEGYVDGLGDAVEQGLVKAVGVSNYNERRLLAAHEQLAKRGIPLASNQVHYSLVYRFPEENNVKKTCDELGVSLIAYSPLGQGILSGKYSASNPPPGGRGRTYNADFLTQAAPLLSKMREIGNEYGKSPTQVALNWLLIQGNVVPIPEAKSASQAQEFAGALGWSLSDDHERELHSLAKRVKPVVGFPAESF